MEPVTPQTGTKLAVQEPNYTLHNTRDNEAKPGNPKSIRTSPRIFDE